MAGVEGGALQWTAEPDVGTVGALLWLLVAEAGHRRYKRKQYVGEKNMVLAGCLWRSDGRGSKPERGCRQWFGPAVLAECLVHAGRGVWHRGIPRESWEILRDLGSVSCMAMDGRGS